MYVLLFLRLVLWPMGHLETCFEFSRVGDSYVVFLLLISSLISLRLENTLYVYMIQFFKCVEVCFMAQELVYLSMCSVGTWKEHGFCCCWLKYSANIDRILWVNGVVCYHAYLALLSSCCFQVGNWNNSKVMPQLSSSLNPPVSSANLHLYYHWLLFLCCRAI